MGRFFYIKPLFILALLVFLFSCSDSDVKISYVKVFTILDYREPTQSPEIRLAVFVETSNGVNRAESVKIHSRASDYEWVSDKLIKISNSDTQWASCVNFVCPNNTLIPEGSYELNFIDAQNKEEKTAFSIFYPENIELKNASALEESLNNNFVESTAAYDKNGVMLSYESGQDKKDMSAVFEENTDVAYCRRCLELTQGTVYCLMPPVYREK